MNSNLPAFVVVLAACVAMPVAAQDVYRCGNSYTHNPLRGRTLVPTDDARSADQSSAAREAAQRAAKMAEAMEKARLKEEAKAAVYVPPPPPDPQWQPEEQRLGVVKPKKPAYFTARAPGKPGDPPHKKKTKKKKSAQQERGPL
jgi:hypothetical protein